MSHRETEGRGAVVALVLLVVLVVLGSGCVLVNPLRAAGPATPGALAGRALSVALLVDVNDPAARALRQQLSPPRFTVTEEGDPLDGAPLVTGEALCSVFDRGAYDLVVRVATRARGPRDALPCATPELAWVAGEPMRLESRCQQSLTPGDAPVVGVTVSLPCQATRGALVRELTFSSGTQAATALQELLPNWPGTVTQVEGDTLRVSVGDGVTVQPGALATVVSEAPRSAVVTGVTERALTLKATGWLDGVPVGAPVEFGRPLWALGVTTQVGFKPGVGFRLGGAFELFPVSVSGPMVEFRTATVTMTGTGLELAGGGGYQWWLVPLRLAVFVRAELGGVWVTRFGPRATATVVSGASAGVKLRFGHLVFVDLFGGADLALGRVDAPGGVAPWTGPTAGAAVTFELDGFGAPR